MTGFASGGTGETPNRTPEETRQGMDFCEAVRQAVNLRRLAEGVDRAAHDATSFVINKSFLGNLPFRLGGTFRKAPRPMLCKMTMC